MNNNIIIHPFEPVYDENSKILILGSFPSVKSRENEFYYGHERNRFWKIISSVFDCEPPRTIEEKKEILLTHCIALWDVAASCCVEASSDSSIHNVVPNDICKLLQSSKIKAIYANGKTAEKLYNKLILPKTNIKIIPLPSTSPANAAFSSEKLISFWSIIKQS